MDVVLLLAQMVMTGALATWMTLGVRDNILHPRLNEQFTGEVLDMARLRDGYPDAYHIIAHRRVTSDSARTALFRLAVIWETLSCLVLWAGTLALGLALVGFVDLSTARPAAMLGTLMFTMIWAGFLIIGEHFAYWFGHEGAQTTHFHMLLWGIGVMLLLIS